MEKIESIEELNSKDQFRKLCCSCHLRCNDDTRICLAKRLAYNLAKREYKKRVKKGEKL